MANLCIELNYTTLLIVCAIPSPAAMIHFSALAFPGTHKSHEFMKLRLSNLIIMAEPTERRSNRSRKPKVHFDNQIAESIGPLNVKGVKWTSPNAV